MPRTSLPFAIVQRGAVGRVLDCRFDVEHGSPSGSSVGPPRAGARKPWNQAGGQHQPPIPRGPFEKKSTRAKPLQAVPAP